MFIDLACVLIALEISNYLNVPLGEIKVGQFNDGEVNIEVRLNVPSCINLKKILEEVRGKDIYII